MGQVNLRKVAMIGCGYVGSAAAFALMQNRLFAEIVLIDVDQEKAEGEAMDIGHGIPLVGNMKIYAGSYDDITDAAIIVITAGAGQKPGIYQKIIPEITKRSCQGILLVVSNPVDILTYVTVKLSGFPENRVIGSGTVLDTARLKYQVGEHLAVDSKSVHAFIIGEHGDSEIAVWSSANISGVPLDDFCEMRGQWNHDKIQENIAETVKRSAYEIIERKQATYYGVAMTIKRICEVIIRDEKSILPVSTMMHGEFGIDDVALSMPSIVGADGFEVRVPISLNEEECKNLRKSAQTLKEILKQCDQVAIE